MASGGHLMRSDHGPGIGLVGREADEGQELLEVWPPGSPRSTRPLSQRLEESILTDRLAPRSSAHFPESLDLRIRDLPGFVILLGDLFRKR